MEPSSYRILIVDDEPVITALLASLLSSQGYLCETATNGRAALEMVSQSHFDVVITDILMPEMDGITLTQKLSHQFPNLFIMVMKGYL
jgi:CheY-like chemotaxis protein